MKKRIISFVLAIVVAISGLQGFNLLHASATVVAQAGNANDGVDFSALMNGNIYLGKYRHATSLTNATYGTATKETTATPVLWKVMGEEQINDKVGATDNTTGDGYLTLFSRYVLDTTPYSKGTPVTTAYIAAQPANKSVKAGQTASFTIGTAGGTSTYQWQINTGSGFANVTDGSGGTTATYTTPTLTTIYNNYQYRCVISPGSVNSDSATLEVVDSLATAPIIATHPSSVFKYEGQSAIFTVLATGSSITYQWMVSSDGGASYTNIPNATFSTYVVPYVSSGDNNKKYKCYVTNSTGNITSAAATITVAASSIPMPVFGVSGIRDFLNNNFNDTNTFNKGEYSSIPATNIVNRYINSSDRKERIVNDYSGFYWPNTISQKMYLPWSLNYTSLTNKLSWSAAEAVEKDVAGTNGITSNVKNLVDVSSNFALGKCKGATSQYVNYWTGDVHGIGCTYINTVNGGTNPVFGLTSQNVNTANNGGLNGVRPAFKLDPTKVVYASEIITSENGYTVGTTEGDNYKLTLVQDIAGTLNLTNLKLNANMIENSDTISEVTNSYVVLRGSTSLESNNVMYKIVNSSGSIVSYGEAASSGNTEKTISVPTSGLSGTYSLYLWEQQTNVDSSNIASNPIYLTLNIAGSINSFIFNTLNPPIPATINGTNITALVPYGTNVTSLTPLITKSQNTTISPSGAQNFSSPVTYILTSSDGTTRQYTVTVVVESTAQKGKANAGIDFSTLTGNNIYFGKYRHATSFSSITYGAATKEATATPVLWKVMGDEQINDGSTNTSVDGYSTLLSKYVLDSAYFGKGTYMTSSVAPIITAHPSSLGKTTGQTANFTVVSLGSGVSYQWKVSTDNGVSFSNVSTGTGGTTSSYTTPSLVIGDNLKQYKCVVTNSAGSVTSDAAILSVEATAPIITIHPNSQKRAAGQVANFTAAGTAISVFQWQVSTDNGSSWSNIAGANSAVYMIPYTTISQNNNQYRCILTYNIDMSATTNVATLSVVDSLSPTPMFGSSGLRDFLNNNFNSSNTFNNGEYSAIPNINVSNRFFYTPNDGNYKKERIALAPNSYWGYVFPNNVSQKLYVPWGVNYSDLTNVSWAASSAVVKDGSSVLTSLKNNIDNTNGFAIGILKGSTNKSVRYWLANVMGNGLTFAYNVDGSSTTATPPLTVSSQNITVSDMYYGVRPAFKLNRESVIYSNEITTNGNGYVVGTGGEKNYKLTVVQNDGGTLNLSNVQRSGISVPNNSIVQISSGDLGLTGTTSSSSNTVKYKIVNSSNSIVSYGQAAPAGSTSKTVTVPTTGLLGSYDLYLWEQQDNIDVSNIGSNPIHLILNVGSVSVTGVTLDSNSGYMGTNEIKTLTATVSPSNAIYKNVFWTSSDESVAKVSNGIITTLTEGTVIITVTTIDGWYSSTYLLHSVDTSVNSTTEFELLKNRLPKFLQTDYTTINGQISESYEYEVPWTGDGPSVVTGSPVIAEWNKTVAPDESITITGNNLTNQTGNSFGSDTTVWIWSGKDNGKLLKAKISKFDDSTLIATIPKELPIDMYILWVENSTGVSAPVYINKTTAEWIGPLGNSADKGETKRIFGKNLTTDLKDLRTQSGVTSNVYIQPTAGGTITKCTVQTDVSTNGIEVNPYSVSFVVPSYLSYGSYNIFVHNGFGGDYGWSNPIPIVLEQKFTLGSYSSSLSPSGGDDSAAINSAITTINNQTGGGTLNLGTGTFTVLNTLNIKGNLKIVGNGSNNTIIEYDAAIQIISGHHNITVENLTFKPKPGGTQTTLYINTNNSSVGGGYNRNILFNGVKFLEGAYGVKPVFSLWAENVEIKNCEFNIELDGTPTAWWIHDNHFNGVRADNNWGSNGTIGFTSMVNDSGKSGRYVIENNFAHTPQWPVGANGNRNYETFESGGAGGFGDRLHETRLVYFSAHSEAIKYGYIARNNTEDVAISTNKGEQILFHSSENGAFMKVQSATTNVITINTQADPNFKIKLGDGNTYQALTAVPNQINFMNGTKSINNYTTQVVITAGKGLGQVRNIVTHTTTTITVDENFRVQPDSTSVIHLMLSYYGQVVYDNTLQGVPEGYTDLAHIASMGISFDGGALFCVADKNTNTRTFYGDSLQGYTGAPSYWSCIKNSKTIDSFRYGAQIGSVVRPNFSTTPTVVSTAGIVQLGNWIRSGEANRGIPFFVSSDASSTSSTFPISIGCGIENTKITENDFSNNPVRSASANSGQSITGITGAILVEHFNNVLIRNILIGQDVPTPKIITGQYAKASYANIEDESGRDILYGGGSVNDGTPNVDYRALHFVAASGNNPLRQNIPLSYYGMKGICSWSIDSISGNFISATTFNDSLNTGNPNGALTVNINTNGLSSGTYSGTIYIRSDNGIVIGIGVKLLIDDIYIGARTENF